MTDAVHPIFEFNAIKSSNKIHVHTFNNSTQVVCFYDNYLRTARIADSKYKSLRLDVKNTDESILNTSGTLIAFYKSKTIDVFTLDGRKTTLDIDDGIRQVLWHPLGYLDSTLVILTEKDTVELYELTDPEYWKPTLVLNHNLSQLGLSSHVSDIRSIAFSPDGLTLYLMSAEESVDLYAFYPLLPRRLYSKASLWASQLHQATALYEFIDKDTPDETKLAIIEFFEFVSKVNQMAERGPEMVEITIPEHRRKVALQGPYMMVGFPEELYNYSASQLTVVPINEDGAHVLITSFDEGTNLIFFPETTPIMSWTRPLHEVYSLILIEKHKALGAVYPIEDGVGIFHPQQGVKLLHLPYLRAIGECISDGNLTAIQDIALESKVTAVPGSYTKPVIWKSPKSPGILLVGDNSVKVEHTGSESALPEEESALKGKYTVCFPSTLHEINEANKQLQRTLRRPLPLVPHDLKNLPLNSSQNELQLAFLTKITKEVVNRIISAQSLAYQLHSRVSIQQYELGRQIDATVKLLDRKDALADGNSTLQSRLESVANKDKSIKRRLDALHETLDKINSSEKFTHIPFSKAELAWFRELRNQVLTFNEYVIQQSKARDEFQFLKTELESLQLKHTKREPFDFSALQNLLHVDSKIITDCNDTLLAAAKDLEQKLYI
ncbi:HBR387Cp [Eremothecium sinecaudum]|uniref:HBR387Cp n=1 Tax=Eremothecium sinecaudum TaxID=45286 RepID=A0A109UXE3_9SACH|nr:HBR387Cp [Eremothecium sinecaudum]AMD19288.1 HBR387Cp [Eremothecium sinecaudum]